MVVFSEGQKEMQSLADKYSAARAPLLTMTDVQLADALLNSSEDATKRAALRDEIRERGITRVDI